MKFVLTITIVAFANLNATPIDKKVTIDDDVVHYEELYQQKITEILKCSTNNFGCLNNRCWINCGPRVNKVDWCFTTRQKKCYRDDVVLKKLSQVIDVERRRVKGSEADCSRTLLIYI